ncbi:PH domain-like protein [Guyanagaster necrorhizus]|uniref:PH domain-like protein n=1 Tax=Guyanagaster necrorhizus TaxID=856835 RepID=A0A9P7W263_9AGAR|nr:PH domain-like protein [Guyanagaster necrorhizus MCA 3950]KAG7451277.1 PH domain-like protein [Guyanagaster necrorhizus MCA 3950]
MSAPAAAPSAQEVQRKLSVHSAAKSPKPQSISVAAVSGTDSDSDSILTPDVHSISSSGLVTGVTGSVHGSALTQAPLSAIAERRSNSGEDTEDEDDEEEGGWKSANSRVGTHDSVDESVIKAGYLWKKGERRKTWKKRWFVLRPTQLAYYKTNAEYQLLRLLELSDVHSCTQVSLKKHENTFGLVSPVRTFYLQAESPGDVQEWITTIDEARQTLLATTTPNSVSSPIPIPKMQDRSSNVSPPMITPSPPSYPNYAQNAPSSDSEDASPVGQRTYSVSSQHRSSITSSPSKIPTGTVKDPTKSVLSGYLMKCGSKRRNWRKRWFVLSGEKLVYYTSHMDAKPHRQFQLTEILDALEYDLPAHRQPLATSPPIPASMEPDDDHSDHTFKIVTTKRTLLLCAPNEEDEIKWLGAIRALIARRSGSGVVPGETTKIPAVTASISPNGSGFTSGSSGGIKGKVRRVSVSGSGVNPGIIIEEGSQN